MTKYSVSQTDSNFRIVSPSFDRLTEEYGSLQIAISSADGSIYLLTFDSYFVFRKIEESYALRILEDISLSAGLDGMIYETDTSDLIDWFRMQADALSEGMVLKHYLIALIDDFIEIVSPEPPMIECKKTATI